MSRSSERGSVLIIVCIACVVLTAFSALVIDYGVLWVGRGQAQNAADAGALAGAIAMAFDVDDRTPTGPAKTAAYAFAKTNDVVGESPNVVDPAVDATDIMFYNDAIAKFPGVCVDDSCIRVDVHRNQTRGNPLPVFFSQLIGVTDQGVRATATARFQPANATDCLRPIAVPDKWFEQNVPATPESFNRYEEKGGGKGPAKGSLLMNPDVYQAPVGTNPGSGYTIAADLGDPFALIDKPENELGEQPGWYQAINVPRASGSTTGAKRVEENLKTCAGLATPVGSFLPTESGGMQGPIRDGIEDLIAQDPYAEWDPNTKTIINSCIPDCPRGTYAFSPRVITLAVYDVDDFQWGQTNNDWTRCPTGGSCVKITNFLGFFVARLDKIKGQNAVSGYLVRAPGLLMTSAPQTSTTTSFLSFISLIR